MPSSLIFVGLVVLWLLILVPIVARRRQVVPRPGKAARAGRVLQRPARRPGRVVEMEEMALDKDEWNDQDPRETGADDPSEDRADAHAEADGDADPAGENDAVDDHDDPAVDSASDPAVDGDGVVDDVAAAAGGPARNYRRGRGGYDPEAAELAASARYASRQRVVLTLLIAALGTGIVAAVGLPIVWYLHGAIDIALVGYLIYLRRQVRLEDEIRFRRAARLAGTRFAHVSAEPVASPAAAAGPDEQRGEQPDEPPTDLVPDPAEPAEPVLPPLPRAELPGRPRGTMVVGPDDEDPALHSLDDQPPPRYRRAAG